MLPVLLLTVPPVVLGGGYAAWCQGQQLVLSIMPPRSDSESTTTTTKGNNRPKRTSMDTFRTQGLPEQTFASYTAGVVTLIGTYNITYMGLSTAFLPKEEARIKSSTTSTDLSKMKHNKHQNKYVPPQTLKEVYQRVGRPGLVRIGAAGMAFFCSGALQTYVAFKL